MAQMLATRQVQAEDLTASRIENEVLKSLLMK